MDGTSNSGPLCQERSKVLLIDIDAANAERTHNTTSLGGGEASVFIGDVKKNNACKAIIEPTVNAFGILDILFNNVGISGIQTPRSVLDIG